MRLSSRQKHNEQLAELYRYIEENATADVALRYTTAIVEYCEGLATFPLRGTPRLREIHAVAALCGWINLHDGLIPSA